MPNFPNVVQVALERVPLLPRPDLSAKVVPGPFVEGVSGDRRPCGCVQRRDVTLVGVRHDDLMALRAAVRPGGERVGPPPKVCAAALIVWWKPLTSLNENGVCLLIPSSSRVSPLGTLSKVRLTLSG